MNSIIINFNMPSNSNLNLKIKKSVKYYKPEDLINLSQYPIHKEGITRNTLIEKVRAELSKKGCAVLKKFITDKAIFELTKESESASNKTHKSYCKSNVYFTKEDQSLPRKDPRRRFFSRSNSFISGDNFAPNGPLKSLQNIPCFDPFIKNCLSMGEFYRYADPLASIVINMAEEGNGFPWHFDTNNFTVTIAIQNASSGGSFEYAPNIRKDHENYEEVSKILDGNSTKISLLNLEPGDLQLFKGRYSLHRVTPLKGPKKRFVAIFSYVEEPNMVGKPGRTKELYGKVLPIHYQMSKLRKDQFID